MTTYDPSKRRKIGKSHLSDNIARNVSALREQRRMTKADLLTRLENLGQPMGGRIGIGRLERRARRIDVDEWYALADALGVPPERLLLDAPVCGQCQDSPPPGYACISCGMRGERP